MTGATTSTMNATATEAQLTRYSERLNSLNHGIGWSTIVTSTLQLLMLAFLVRKSDRLDNESSFPKPINLLLLLMILSNLAWNYINSLTFSPIGAAFCIASGAIYQITVSFYTLERGKPVFLAVAPYANRASKVLVFFVILLQVVSNTLCIYTIEMWDSLLALNIMNVAQIIGNVLSLLFEVFVLYCYGWYIHSLREVSSLMDVSSNIRQLRIISIYGTCTMVWNLFWQGIMNAYGFLMGSLPQTEAEYLVSMSVGGLMILMPTVYIFLQLGMKWALCNEHERELERMKQDLLSAREVTMGSTGDQGIIPPDTCTHSSRKDGVLPEFDSS
ncbi:hypothetical protein BC830DRAFT_1156932 [Chytriomyces sp. MP71]|nr:hypothetical protein BC830DRAFT_1156932 [Chytriomyces sp. MP71]